MFTRAIHDAARAIEPIAARRARDHRRDPAPRRQRRRVEPHIVRGWWKDTGRLEDMLEANRLILDDHRARASTASSIDSQVDGRVIVEAGRAARALDGPRPGDHRRGRAADRLLHRAVHRDRRGLRRSSAPRSSTRSCSRARRCATSRGGWSPRCSGATSRSRAATASRAPTASWSATTPRSGSCNAGGGGMSAIRKKEKGAEKRKVLRE